MKDILGGKGANLAEMSCLGMPVPAGFTIPCEASVAFNSADLPVPIEDFIAEVKSLVESGLAYLTVKKNLPLLSVRSGARVSMPGMMDTILNVGITSETLPVWKKKLGEVAALDSYRRLIQMYSSVALGIDLKLFEAQLESMKHEANVLVDSELNADQLTRLVSRYMKVVNAAGMEFPDTVMAQVMGATLAVFRSWNNPRAIEYRKIYNIPDAWGTAVTVQSMVFGNLNDKSATGVLFSRNPATGKADITGEYLVNAQGEDVVAGIRTPESLESLGKWNPDVAFELGNLVAKLEHHYKDMQDIEFTVEDGKLYLLQTRNAKRAPLAAFTVAHALATEGLITKEVAASRVSSAQLFSLMQDQIDPSFKTPANLQGLAAGGGIASGVAMFTAASAINCKVPCILVTKETDPDDIAGMNASVGILTATGGLTSHAAVVARGMNKSCVVGATDLSFNPQIKTLAGVPPKDGKLGLTFQEGDKITINGATGEVWIGIDVPVISGGASPLVKEVISWLPKASEAVRIDLHHSMSQKSLQEAVWAVKGAPVVQIDTVMLEGPTAYHTSPKIAQTLETLGTVLHVYADGQEFVVDLGISKDYFSNGDEAFDSMFGVSNSSYASIVFAKVSALKKWPMDLAQRTCVKVPDTSNSLSVRKELKSCGFKVSGHVKTFEDLLNADGPMAVSDDTIEAVFGSMSAYKVALKAAEAFNGGKLSKALPVPAYWYDPLTKKEG